MMALQNQVFDTVAKPVTIATATGSLEVVSTTRLSPPLAIHVAWDAPAGLYAVTHTFSGLAFRRGLSAANATALFNALAAAVVAGTINLNWSDPAAMSAATNAFLLTLLASYPDQVVGTGSTAAAIATGLNTLRPVPLDWEVVEENTVVVQRMVFYNTTAATLSVYVRSDRATEGDGVIDPTAEGPSGFEIPAWSILEHDSGLTYVGLSWKASDVGITGAFIT